MGLKARLLKPFAHRIAKNIRKNSSLAVKNQQHILSQLIQSGKKTEFGKYHGFKQIKTYEDFKKAVAIRDYEAFRPYIDMILDGDRNVLWPGKPKYLAKTSGTTSGVKYIPITSESIPNHVESARNALFNYFSQTGNGAFFEGKMIFLSGSPRMENINSIPVGRLSGIINHWVPNWLRPNQMPTYKTNCIEDWEQKLGFIVDETIEEDMRLISGIPPWVQMYYEKLLEKTGKNTIKELFPNFSLFVYGGVNYEPYRSRLEELTGPGIDTLEFYPASEGFIAYQDQWPHQGLMLVTNSGIFYEFIPAEEIFDQNPTRLKLGEIELGVNYALIISSNAGLWGYNIGDTVEFLSKSPYRIKVTGRIKHFISAFGEHVIGNEVEKAIQVAVKEMRCQVSEFTVAPQIHPPEKGLPYHEWLIEFSHPPKDMDRFQRALDQAMIKQNIYYKDLIKGKILQPLKVMSVRQGTFRTYMKSVGRLGGQNKVARLSNDRAIADVLYQLQTELSSDTV
jgi:hypothetical protein